MLIKKICVYQKNTLALNLLGVLDLVSMQSNALEA